MKVGGGCLGVVGGSRWHSRCGNSSSSAVQTDRELRAGSLSLCSAPITFPSSLRLATLYSLLRDSILFCLFFFSCPNLFEVTSTQLEFIPLHIAVEDLRSCSSKYPPRWDLLPEEMEAMNLQGGRLKVALVLVLVRLNQLSLYGNALI